MNFEEYLKKNQKIVWGVTIVLILIFVYNYWQTRSNYDTFIQGVWESDSDFNEKSGISSMLLTIGPNLNWIGEKRSCYLIISANDEVAVDRKILIKFYSLLSLLKPFNISEGKVKINIKDITEEDADIEEVMPENLWMKFSIPEGKIILYDDSEDKPDVYAELYKNHEATKIYMASGDDNE